MTGHRPDQPGNEGPTDSESQNAGADVSADDFAAALKLIVKRLDGQDDEAETPPAGRDSAAVPPTAIRDSAPRPAADEPLWTGLSEPVAAAEPEPASPLTTGAAPAAGSAGGDFLSDKAPDAGAPEPAATTAADLWPAQSPPSEAGGIEDPLFAPAAEPESAAEGASGSASSDATDPLFSPAPGSPAADGDAVESTPSTSADPLFSPAPEPAGGKEPLFVETPAAAQDSNPLFEEAGQAPAAEDPLFATSPEPAADKEPLFVETPAEGDAEPLFAEKPERTDSGPFTVETATAPIDAASAETWPETGSDSPAADPMAGLRNRDESPTIGPAMPAPEPQQNLGAAAESQPPAPSDAGLDPLPAAPVGTPETDSPLDYPQPAGLGVEATTDTEATKTDGLGGAPNDPFAGASRPAFEDESANALFGDTPDLAAQNTPGSSLGPIGAEAEDFDKVRAAERAASALSDRASGDLRAARPDSDLTATRGLDDDAESSVELDQILPPLDPKIGSLEKAADPPKQRRPLRVGAAAFWLLILAILGGIGYWGYEQRHQTVALGEWAQARYALPTGQLAALLARDPEPESPTEASEAPVAPSEPPEGVAALPPAAEPVPAAEAPPPAPQTAGVRPAPAAEPRPAPPEAEPAPQSASTAPPAPAASEPVEVATTTPGRLPAHLAPLPTDVAPEIRVLADRALAGDPLAQHDLANQYAIGETVAQSNSYAAYWYRLASEAGIANAQYNLGVLTARGLGVRKDLNAAFRLFLEAAEARHADAQIATGLSYMSGSGVEQDPLQAASWFQAASANGRPRGAFHLGQLFEGGLDEAPDLAAAAGWYRIAADAGYAPAKEALDRLTEATRAPPIAPAPTSVAAPATTPPAVTPRPDPIPAAPSELVREIQQLLNQLGYDAGPEDGMTGEKTKLAILTFQRSQGLNVTGEASEGLLALLKVVAE